VSGDGSTPPPYLSSRAELVRPPSADPGARALQLVRARGAPPFVPPPPLPVPGALPVLADELEFGFSDAQLGLVECLDRPSSSTASSSFRPDRAERYRLLMSLGGSRYFRPRRFRSGTSAACSAVASVTSCANCPSAYYQYWHHPFHSR
jgi:E3 ubiquitin-protein ligase RNF5